MFQYAVTRRPGRDFAQGVTGSGLPAPDVAKAIAQHERYCDLLRAKGVQVQVLNSEPGFPDSTFVEDIAVVVDDVAVLTNPGLDSRQGEVRSIAPVLRQYGKRIVRIEPPGQVEGGDVLRVGDMFFIGLSARTNEAGIAQLGAFLGGLGYSWKAVEVVKPPHLKTGVSHAGDNTLIMSRAYAEHPAFKAYRRIVVGADGEYAANCLRINGSLIVPAGFDREMSQLQSVGAALVPLDMSEFQKMDGGLTCLSLRFS